MGRKDGIKLEGERQRSSNCWEKSRIPFASKGNNSIFQGILNIASDIGFQPV
jgi:hypothetical protein